MGSQQLLFPGVKVEGWLEVCDASPFPASLYCPLECNWVPAVAENSLPLFLVQLTACFHGAALQYSTKAQFRGLIESS